MYFWLYVVLEHIEDAISYSKSGIMELVMKNLNNLAEGEDGVHYDIDEVTDDILEGYELNLDDRHKFLMYKELVSFIDYQSWCRLQKFNPYSEENELLEYGKYLTKLGFAKKYLLKEIELLTKEGD